MSALLQLAVDLHPISCGECGGTYAINEVFRAQCSKKGTAWTCPYCKTGWGYTGNSENEKLKKEIEAERVRKQAALQRANEAEENLAKTLRKHKRLEKRTNAGVCPHCPRTFQNLARHIACKHPEQAAA